MANRRYPNLKSYLARTGTSQRAFARRMGVDKAIVSRVIGGKQGLALRRALQWSQVAHVPIESFLKPEQDSQ